MSHHISAEVDKFKHSRSEADFSFPLAPKHSQSSAGVRLDLVVLKIIMYPPQTDRAYIPRRRRVCTVVGGAEVVRIRRHLKYNTPEFAGKIQRASQNPPIMPTEILPCEILEDIIHTSYELLT